MSYFDEPVGLWPRWPEKANGVFEVRNSLTFLKNFDSLTPANQKKISISRIRGNLARQIILDYVFISLFFHQ